MTKSSSVPCRFFAELPTEPPTISGGRQHYKVGDTARLNCTSARSKPAPSLTWYINGVEVNT